MTWPPVAELVEALDAPTESLVAELVEAFVEVLVTSAGSVTADLGSVTALAGP